MSSPVWHPLTVRGGGYNPAVVALAKGASGAYAIRRSSDHEVVYVGSAARGTLWKTLLRHFQAVASFKALREGFVVSSPVGWDVALDVTSRGARPRAGTKREAALRKKGVAHRSDADQRASAAEARWIATLRPSNNKDDAKADAVAQELRELRVRQEEEDREGGAFGALLNPSVLNQLGMLTRLDLADGTVLSWSLRDAPVLAYDPQRTKAGGRCLVLCYRGRVVRPSTKAERREYLAKHWDAVPEGKVRDCGSAVGPYKSLGPSTSITYTTRKGAEAKLTDYVHPWGEGAMRRCVRPKVEEHACGRGCGPRCAAKGAIRLTGGTYSLEDRGIVG